MRDEVRKESQRKDVPEARRCIYISRVMQTEKTERPQNM